MPRESQLSDVSDLPVQVLAASALLAEILLDKPGLHEDMAEKLRDRRKVFLDELVARKAIESYSFV